MCVYIYIYVCIYSKSSDCYRMIQKYRYQRVPSTTWLSACFYSLNVRHSIQIVPFTDIDILT